MATQASVLIVDRSEENREVLRTALRRRGMITLEATRAEHGLLLAREHQPDLIVLDMEACVADVVDTRAEFERATPGHAPAMVVLGSMRLGATPPGEAGNGSGEFIAKPYHYGPLILKIEQLLEEARQTVG